MERLEWGGLPVVHLIVLVAIAVVGHLALRRTRRPILDRIHELTGGPTYALAGFADTVLGLLYVAFIAATFGFEGARDATVVDAGRVLDNLALFAIYVVVVNLFALRAVYRRSASLDGWPDEKYRTPAHA